MRVGDFREFLLQLAVLYDGAAKNEVAAGLRKLAEVFDGDQNHKLAKFLEDIRRARGV